MATRMPAEVPQYALLIGVFTRGRTPRTRARFFRTVLGHPQLGTPAEQIGNHTDIGQDFVSGIEHFRCRRLARPCWAGASDGPTRESYPLTTATGSFGSAMR